MCTSASSAAYLRISSLNFHLLRCISNVAKSLLALSFNYQHSNRCWHWIHSTCKSRKLGASDEQGRLVGSCYRCFWDSVWQHQTRWSAESDPHLGKWVETVAGLESWQNSQRALFRVKASGAESRLYCISNYPPATGSPVGCLVRDWAILSSPVQYRWKSLFGKVV